MDWYHFDNGKSIGTRGSEGGIIIEDQEHIDGARITLEKEITVAPFAITFGIYGNMFHTHYESNLEDAIKYINAIKLKIEAAIDHLKKPTDGAGWEDTFYKLMQDLTE